MDQVPLWHLPFREGLGSAALESSVFRVSFCGCVWRLGPTMPYLGTKQNRGRRSGMQGASAGCGDALGWLPGVLIISFCMANHLPNQVARNTAYYYFTFFFFFLHDLLLFWKMQSAIISLLISTFSLELLGG